MGHSRCPCVLRQRNITAQPKSWAELLPVSLKASQVKLQAIYSTVPLVLVTWDWISNVQGHWVEHGVCKIGTQQT